jgi:4-hydroxybenzoate polyprenyltransferase
MSNAFSKPAENNASFLERFWIYQRERFPVFGHGPLVAAFSFSAIAYSRICRGAEGFVPWDRYLIGIVTTITLFLLVRIFDEFKDRKEDAQYRPELPVPRGLVSLRELAIVGIIVAVIQIVLNALFFPKMFLIYCIVIGYLLLMGKEFFISKWLKEHQFWYVTSHMLIIPLIDIYASGLDWLVEGQMAPKGLIFFFIVSFFNGIVLEIGRKIRTPEKEAEGVLTYSSMHGPVKATIMWLVILLVTFCWAVTASWFAGYGQTGLLVMGIIFLICALPAVLFLRKMTAKSAKLIEYASALWTIAMYLSLGGIPMVTELMHK